jgi:hypothetical protein
VAFSVAVKHAGPGALARLAPLLEALRRRPALSEKRPGVFYLASRAFLHFHEDPAGLFADVRLGEEFVRFPVTSAAERATLIERIDARLRDAGRPARRRG